MSRPFLLVAAGTLLSAGMVGTLPAQVLSTTQWRADLEYVASAILAHHPNPFHVISAEAFQGRVEQLHERIAELEDHEIIVAMAVLVATLQDGHTAIRGGTQFLTGQYPLRLEIFADGIFVRSAPDALRGTIGTRLLSIGNVRADEAFRRVASMTSHDNEMTLKSRVPSSMTIPEILHALGITPERDRARFVLADQEGREFILDLAPLPFDEQLNWIEDPDGDARPLYLRYSNVNYRNEYLEGSGTLYVQYNRVRDAADETIADYFTRLSQFVEETPLQRIVLDVRLNGGGNDYLNTSVVDWVRSSLPFVDGQFYVIIGRGTFSAAQKLVTRLEGTTDVIFVGEPTGGSPNHFGDAVTLRLPNSDLTLTVSSRYHNDAPGDGRRSIEPDLSAPLSYEEFLSGRDPAMEVILSTRESGNLQGR